MATFIVGRPVPHIEGRAKVSGEARYSADIVLLGMLWGEMPAQPVPACAYCFDRYLPG
jgi:hypothetical protein